MKSPSRNIRDIVGASFAQGIQQGLSIPVVFMDRPLKLRSAPDINETNAPAVIQMMRERGYKVGVMYRRDYSWDDYYYDVRITAPDGRQDGENDTTLSSALHYALGSFWSDDGLWDAIVAITGKL